MALTILYKSIMNAIVESVVKDIDKFSHQLEKKYPQWRGSRVLKRRGTPFERKIIFGYKNKHAEKLIAGSPSKPIRGKYVQQVKSHKRKGSGGQRTRVKSHKRVYRNYKPVQLPDGQWRMLRNTVEVKGKNPIRESAIARYAGRPMEKLIVEAIKDEMRLKTELNKMKSEAVSSPESRM